jgi:hypothetical protein
MWWAFSLFACLYVTGCTSTRDVSHDKSYLGSSAIGQTYRLRFPVNYYDFNTGRLPFDHYPVVPGYWLLLEESQAAEDTKSFSYFVEIEHPDKGIRGVVEAGTSLSLNKIIYHNYFEGETSYYVFLIGDGQFKGRQVCGNELMQQTSPTNSLRLVPNTKYLEQVTPPDAVLEPTPTTP